VNTGDPFRRGTTLNTLQALQSKKCMKPKRKSDSLIVLRGRESRPHGEAMSRKPIFLRKHKLHSVAVREPLFNERNDFFMVTGLERIAAKARSEKNAQFTSLTHHITKERILGNLKQIPKKTSVGTDGINRDDCMKYFLENYESVLNSIHNKGYKAPPVRRVYIPKPGKSEKRPIDVPTILDRALQRTVSEVLSNIYEQDFLNCSFGGRPQKSAHNALCTLDNYIARTRVNWVYEADLKNFFGSLNHAWVLKFLEHRVKDPRIISLIRRWLKAGVWEEGEIKSSEVGTPQGGSISVLLSNIYLHYVLDLWFEKVVKPKMKGECYLIRYLDDFIVLFQREDDLKRFVEVLPKRLSKFDLQLEPEKTKHFAFGRFEKDKAKLNNYKRKPVIKFLGFSIYTYFKIGKFVVEFKTESKRLARSLQKLKERLRLIKHIPLAAQAIELSSILRGHFNYYGLGGNSESIKKFHHEAIKYWRKTLSDRSQNGRVKWERMDKYIELFSIPDAKLKIPYSKMSEYVLL
jgi:RNA-directed DNA polymerase